MKEKSGREGGAFGLSVCEQARESCCASKPGFNFKLLVGVSEMEGWRPL